MRTASFCVDALRKVQVMDGLQQGNLGEKLAACWV